MGEGWGDFHALLHDGARRGHAIASNATGAASTRATPSAAPAPRRRRYFGIRRLPYSTDLTKNPLTFRHIADGVPLPAAPPVGEDGAANSEVHNTGEVWATMLWECYAALLRERKAPPRLTFARGAGAHERLPRRRVQDDAGRPDVLEARDALLLAAAANDADSTLVARSRTRSPSAARAAARSRRTATPTTNTPRGRDLLAERLDRVRQRSPRGRRALVRRRRRVRRQRRARTLTITVRNTGARHARQHDGHDRARQPNVLIEDGSRRFPAIGPSRRRGIRNRQPRRRDGAQELDFDISIEDRTSPAGPR